MTEIKLWDGNAPLFNGETNPIFHFYPAQSKRSRGTLHPGKGFLSDGLSLTDFTENKIRALTAEHFNSESTSKKKILPIAFLRNGQFL